MASITISRLRDGSISISGLVCKSTWRGCFRLIQIFIHSAFCSSASFVWLSLYHLIVICHLQHQLCRSFFSRLNVSVILDHLSDKIQYNSGYENWEQQSRSKCKTSFSAGCAWPLYHLIQPSRNQSSSCLIYQIYIYI